MQLSPIQLKKIQNYFAKQKDIVAVYLYGSFAKDTTHKRSDMDFGVLFYNKVDLYRRLGRLNSELDNLKLPAETEVREIDLNYSPLYLMNVIQGKLIYAKNDLERINFEVAVMREFYDTQGLRDISYNYMRRRLQEGTYGY